MAVITATSDFGYKDPTLAQLKARFSGKIPALEWVDISHEVEPNNRMEAAYMIKTTYQDFPKGTVHLILVKSAPAQFLDFLCVQANGHYFICADNGILPSVLSSDDKITASQKIDVPETQKEDALGIFARAALHLLQGGKPSVLGPTFMTLQNIRLPRPSYDDTYISGTVIYITRDGSCITNLNRYFCESIAQGREMRVIDKRNRRFGTIGMAKSTVKAGDAVVYWDKSNDLRLSIFESGGPTVKGANELLGLRVGDWIKIELQ